MSIAWELALREGLEPSTATSILRIVNLSTSLSWDLLLYRYLVVCNVCARNLIKCEADQQVTSKTKVYNLDSKLMCIETK